ncbi:MAG TPA: hypothetical protein VL280_02295 [Burkholderiales bacterium]|nr:hypothetical protein [Burkholderiales bacterium]
MTELSPLPLQVIGWLYIVICAIALLVGAWLVIGVHFSGHEARKQLASRVIDDAVLFGIWILGLAGGIGVVLGKSWSTVVLEFFCWVLIVLVSMTALSRFRAGEPPRITLGLSLLLFVIPVLAFCGATIYTLRAAP